jgi:hypothetical protein
MDGFWWNAGGVRAHRRRPSRRLAALGRAAPGLARANVPVAGNGPSAVRPRLRRGRAADVGRSGRAPHLAEAPVAQTSRSSSNLVRKPTGTVPQEGCVCAPAQSNPSCPCHHTLPSVPLSRLAPRECEALAQPLNGPVPAPFPPSTYPGRASSRRSGRLCLSESFPRSSRARIGPAT